MSHQQDKQDKQDRIDQNMIPDSYLTKEHVTEETSSGVNETVGSTHLTEAEQAAVSRAQRTSKARARRRELQAERHAKRQAEQEAQVQAEYERHPFQWKSTYWLMEPQLLEAALSLPPEGYRIWLSRHAIYEPAGVQPSAYENPISAYLGTVMGIQPQLQTNGQRAWFLLQLTKPMRETDARYLRVVLPAWVTPLALEYTGFPVRRTSGHPQPKEVSAYDAFRLLERVLSDSAPSSEEQ